MQFIKKFCRAFGKELQLKNFGFQYHHVEQFYRSQWQKGECSLVYLIYRWLWASFFVGVFIACLALQFSDGKYFIFLTNWGIMLCLATQLIAAAKVTCWHYDLGGVRSDVIESGAKARTTGLLKLYWLLHGVALSLSLVITTVYWLFLHGKMNKPTRFPVISFVTHCLNSVFMLTDFLIIAFPVRILHMIYSMLLPIIFCLFTVVYYFCGGTDEYGNHYVYPILDWTKPVRGMTTFGGVFVLYIIYWLALFIIFKLKRVINRACSVVWTPHAVGLI